MVRLLLFLLTVGAATAGIMGVLARRRGERLALIRSTFLVGTASTREVGPPLKDASLRNGALCIRIPAHWAEEYPDRDRAAFRDPSAPRRVLRVTSELCTEELRSLLQSRAGVGATAMEDLSDGRVLLKALGTAREEGQDLVVFRWLIASAEGPSHLRLATFALSLPAEVALDPLTSDLVALIDREIRVSRSGPQSRGQE